jgi:hypothetical protein
VNIICALFPKLDGDAAAVDAAVAAFENRLRLARLRACSSCAGDYEDPDRTAWTDDDLKDDDIRQPGPGDKLPVQPSELQERRE